jgi:hypothetical protein
MLVVRGRIVLILLLRRNVRRRRLADAGYAEDNARVQGWDVAVVVRAKGHFSEASDCYRDVTTNQDKEEAR